MANKGESPAEHSLSWCGVVTRIVLRHRWLFALASLALWGAMGTAAATGLKLQAGIEHMIDDAAAPELAVKDAPFAVESEIGVIVRGPVFSEPFLTHLRALQNDLDELRRPQTGPDQTQPRVFTSAKSLLDVRQVRSEGDLLEFRKLGDLLAQGAGVLASAARSDRNVVPRFVDEAGTSALIVLTTPNLTDPEALEVNAALGAVVAKHRGPEFAIQTAGLTVLKAMVSRLMYDDALRLTVLAVVFSLAVLILTFKHPIGVIGPALVIGQTLATMFGTMALTGVPLTVVGLYLPGLVAVISIMDAIHIQSMFRALSGKERQGPQAIIEAASIAGAPMLYTAGTTCLGLLSLRVARLEAVRDLGTFGAFGVAVAVLYTLITIPIVLSLYRGDSFGRPESGEPDWLDRALVRLEDVCHHARFGRARLALGITVVALSAVGITRLQIRHDTLEWLPSGNALTPAIAALDERLCGSASMTVLLDFEQPNMLKQPDTLARLARVESAIRTYRDPLSGKLAVKDVSSVLDMVRGVWRAIRDPGDNSQLPANSETAAGVFNFLELFAPRDLNELATSDGQHARLNVRRTWADADRSQHAIEHVRAAFHHEFGPSLKLAIVGPMVEMDHATSSILHDLVNSFSVGIVTIALVFIAFLRSLRLGILAILPNTLPVGMTLGVMGFLGFPLDVHTMLLASVVLGIVDDDTFHFMHHFRAHYLATGDTEASLHRSFAQTGRSLVLSACTLALGFLTFIGASMHQMQRTAILLAFTVLSATLTEFMLTPALLRRFVRPRAGGTANENAFNRDRAVAN